MSKKQVQVGDLVKVKFSAYKFGSLPQALRVIPYDELAFVIEVSGNVCVVAFTYPEQKIMSFLKSQIEIVSEAQINIYQLLSGSYVSPKKGESDG
jgi:hypothetical protein